MKTIWKFPISVQREFAVEMPATAEILCVQLQADMPTMWALVDPETPLQQRSFAIYGTGHPIDGFPGQYLGTFQQAGGSFVWHLFER